MAVVRAASHSNFVKNQTFGHHAVPLYRFTFTQKLRVRSEHRFATTCPPGLLRTSTVAFGFPDRHSERYPQFDQGWSCSRNPAGGARLRAKLEWHGCVCVSADFFRSRNREQVNPCPKVGLRRRHNLEFGGVLAQAAIDVRQGTLGLEIFSSEWFAQAWQIGLITPFIILAVAIAARYLASRGLLPIGYGRPPTFRAPDRRRTVAISINK
jgi:hypothetical protein